MEMKRPTTTKKKEEKYINERKIGTTFNRVTRTQSLYYTQMKRKNYVCRMRDKMRN